MKGREWILDGIGVEAFERLAAELPGTELQSLLLEVMQRRAEARSPAEVLAQYQRDGFCKPAATDLRTALEIDRELLEAAEAFESMELSPVAPLGACSAVAVTSQNRVLSALRSTEVVSDPTNVLALECAQRMRRAPGASVHLTTCQRVIRAQAVPKLPGYAPHFRIFVLASAGRETEGHGFTAETLLLHIRTMLRALYRLEARGYGFGVRRVEVHATELRAAVADRVAQALGPLASRKVLEHSYYSAGLRYTVWVTAPDGSPVPLVDGGAFDWLQRLASNRRAVYIASGAGSQLIAMRFRRPPAASAPPN